MKIMMMIARNDEDHRHRDFERKKTKAGNDFEIDCKQKKSYDFSTNEERNERNIRKLVF